MFVFCSHEMVWDRGCLWSATPQTPPISFYFEGLHRQKGAVYNRPIRYEVRVYHFSRECYNSREYMTHNTLVFRRCDWQTCFLRFEHFSDQFAGHRPLFS